MQYPVLIITIRILVTAELNNCVSIKIAVIHKPYYTNIYEQEHAITV